MLKSEVMSQTVDTAIVNVTADASIRHNTAAATIASVSGCYGLVDNLSNDKQSRCAQNSAKARHSSFGQQINRMEDIDLQLVPAGSLYTHVEPAPQVVLSWRAEVTTTGVESLSALVARQDVLAAADHRSAGHSRRSDTPACGAASE